MGRATEPESGTCAGSGGRSAALLIPVGGNFDGVTPTTRSQRQTERLRRTFVDAVEVVLDLTRGLREDDYAVATPVPGWDVRLLVGFALWRLTEVSLQLQRPSVTRPVSLNQYAAHALATAQRRRGQALAVAGQDSGPRLGEQLVARGEDLVIYLTEEALPPLVDTGAGQLSLLDFLRVHVLEIVLASDDLAGALETRGRDVARQGQAATATAVRTLADLLAARAPGQAIEVRVPPYAAVQIGDPTAETGSLLSPTPTHTRGTPPAVIETDATTFLRVMSGRVTWQEALRDHAVAASGLRADLSPLLPLVG